MTNFNLPAPTPRPPPPRQSNLIKPNKAIPGEKTPPLPAAATFAGFRISGFGLPPSRSALWRTGPSAIAPCATAGRSSDFAHPSSGSWAAACGPWTVGSGPWTVPHFCTISAPFLPHLSPLDFHNPLCINHSQFSPSPLGAILLRTRAHARHIPSAPGEALARFRISDFRLPSSFALPPGLPGRRLGATMTGGGFGVFGLVRKRKRWIRFLSH